MKPQNDLFNVDYQINDRGADYPVLTAKHLKVPSGSSVSLELKKRLNKDRAPMGLSTKFTFKITSQNHVGWA